MDLEVSGRMEIEKREIKAGKYNWFYRECNPIRSSNQSGNRSPVILLHGFIAQSYSWRNIQPVLAAQGFRSLAIDWLGCANSEVPDRLDFPYSPTALQQAFSELITALKLEKFSLVLQGFPSVIALQYALKNPDQIDRLVILNTPISAQSKLPWSIKQLGLPLLGEALVQNFRLPDQLMEGGGGYPIDEENMITYRRPWLTGSDWGRALHHTIRQLNLSQLGAEVESGLKTWEKPLLIAWGDRDPWLPIAAAQTTAKSFPAAKFVRLTAVGHYPQEDRPEQVNDTIGPFLRR
jgi:pimeloyl-ACP methyl ester carboxylesterase